MLENQSGNHKVDCICSARVGNSMAVCRYCNHQCIKYGKTGSGKQRLLCRNCGRTTLANSQACKLSSSINTKIKTLLKEGCGIRNISRILKIAASTVIRRIKVIAAGLKPPLVPSEQTFELDELCTFIGNKRTPVWIAYAINKHTKQVAACSIGNRSNQMLSQVTEPLLQNNPLKIHTDKLLHYKSLIPPHLHCTKKFGINHIERKNLTLRTHLKRLNRKTICFSRSIAMLRACLMIYFFS